MTAFALIEAGLWSVEADVRCITTNGTVRPDGTNVMGGGCAREAADRDAELPERYGHLIRKHGNHVFLVGDLVMFPVKHEVQFKAELSLIERSVEELLMLADIYQWERIALPRPGCGLGGLSWDDEVAPVLEPWLNERFVIVDYPRVSA